MLLASVFYWLAAQEHQLIAARIPARAETESVEQATLWARVTQGIRCARLRVSDQRLRLVDPFSGRILTLADCKS